VLKEQLVSTPGFLKSFLCKTSSLVMWFKNESMLEIWIKSEKTTKERNNIKNKRGRWSRKTI